MLIAAVRGKNGFRQKALAIVTNPSRSFFYSPFLKLELTLQAEYNGNKKELAFYAEYFRSASCYGDLDRIFEIASKEARKNGVAVLDAMHLAAANLARCEVFITGEKATRPMHRTELVKVVCFQSLTD